MSTKTRGSAVVTLPADDQILIVREFAAPAAAVFRAWTEPELVKRWWAGTKGTVTSAEVDLRVGGGWRWVMEANGGFEVAFHGEYREIVPAERLVFTEVFEGIPDADAAYAVTSLDIVESGGRTTVSMLVQHQTREHRDMHVQSGMEEGMQTSLDALEDVAAGL
ncbi:SRPBCC family protein [Pseudonocardia pini]|uniref:SRPBCC family protein n=1 Tax=Pseudonocardia pini TaxID=2758030 RepID=UPI0015EFF046|nr:SRPBCC family protein [Pseudonocardia pini]